MGEKFSANPVTGTGSMTVPIATSPGRSGFGPQLSLSYDSGAGNGPFGFGWHLSLPSITRKTDKGLPQYHDTEESDVFILSGAEDLVPEFEKDEGGNWALEKGKHAVHEKPRTIDGITYRVRRYRPRIEGLFARIERWTNTETGEIHWRSLSKDNITTLYGKDNKSRIFDPAELDEVDPADLGKAHPTRIFSWLICESYDDKGNAIIYEYQPEDSQRIFEDQQGQSVALAHERNRNNATRSANRYLKRIKYGNRLPNRDAMTWQATDPTQLPGDTWMFEVVFDYGEHTPNAPTTNDAAAWPARNDPFSSYRAGFEVRTYRLCQRVLMFHHFPDEPEVGSNCLVRSTEFQYSYEIKPADARNAIYSFLLSVTQSGYKRQIGAGYLKKSLPPVEFTYSEAAIKEDVREIDPASLENLPFGLDGTFYQWVDLDGEGISGILTEQADAWFYKRNLSPLPEANGNGSEEVRARFAPVELVATKPAASLASHAQFMDLAGDGQSDVVIMEGSVRGFYERTDDASWESLRPFRSFPNLDTRDPNLKFLDLDGDGHTDILISEDEVFRWHPSLAEDGFGAAEFVRKPFDEEKGPALVFADGTQSIYLSDMSGDGLTDLVRIRNGEVCYWPNLGYGRFGAKVTMDNAPWFDSPDLFDQKRIRLADIDGSGTTDIIYLHSDGPRIYFNQSGNSWSKSQPLTTFPRIDNLTSVQVLDLLGNGTACIVWSSPLPGDAGRRMRYVDLMGGVKPHLHIKTVNNLGAETVVFYAPSTKFYLQDKQDGAPWITKLPFPVHVVERVETWDHIGRNRFVTRYAYHHGYFGEEREFRGFGRVDQWDSEEFAVLTASGTPIAHIAGHDEGQAASNLDAASHVPPVRTVTWFHTGAYIEGEKISRHFEHEYYGAPQDADSDLEQKWNDFERTLLPDTVLPSDLTLEEEREACRALKGSMLRQEVYGLDGTDKEQHPYTVTEQNFTIECLQPREGQRHAVFLTHPREVLSYHYERNPDDPRIGHAMTLEVDHYGNVLKSVAIGYGRDQSPFTEKADREKQTSMLITFTEDSVTKAIDDAAHPDDYRAPLPSEARTYELHAGPGQGGYTPTGKNGYFQFKDFVEKVGDELKLISSGVVEVAYESVLSQGRTRRLIEHVRTLYRRDDLTALLPLGELEPLALPGESCKLAFTPGLLGSVFRRPRNDGTIEDLLSNAGPVLQGEGGYVASQHLRSQNLFPAGPGEFLWTTSDEDNHWWIPSGRSFYSRSPNDTAALELAEARAHFFLLRRFQDPFLNNAYVDYDDHNLLLVGSEDALQNKVTSDGDYRVLQPRLITDPNNNRSQVVFDALGLVAGTAVMGKASGPAEGDLLDASFTADLTQTQIDDFFAQPRRPGPTNSESEATTIVHEILGNTTTRIVHDLERFSRTRKDNPAEPEKWEPPFAATITRETHFSDLSGAQHSKLQVSFSYSDGFGREIQKKISAERGPLDLEDPNSAIINPRWVGSGWTIFNNKGKPVRQYEPFFSATHRVEFGVIVGVSPVLFYDPAERVIARLHPNHTYEKVVFDPWQQTTYDVNDTCAPRNQQSGDPRTDPDITGYVAEYFKAFPANPAQPWQTWHAQRIGGALGEDERNAALRAAAHADTPTTAHFDALGRPFLTVARNRVVCTGHDLDGTEDSFATRVELDIEGNQREVRDERKLPVNHLPTGAVEQRVVMRYAYDMLGNRIRQISMEAGVRWMLNDVTGKPIRAWDSRGHNFTTSYDVLRRPIGQTVRGTTTDSDPRTLISDILVDKIRYGENLPNAEALNLRTRIYRHFDSAGVTTNARLDANDKPTKAYDFKGNLLHSTRRLVRDYTAIPDWLSDQQLEDEFFEGNTRYDALNRPVQSIAPRSSLGRGKFNVIQPLFNEANLLERLDVWLERAVEPAGLLDGNNEAPSPVGVINVDYDAKGQRLQIHYKNGASTFYSYDPLTFRLTQLLTRRDAVPFPGDDPQPPIAGWPGKQMQNLRYTYDPGGNITHIQDDAQQRIYFKNKRVEPSNDYIYDALYRLIHATGREHLGQGGAAIPHSHDDEDRIRRPHPNEGDAMGAYIERYVYDAVGNFLQMQHRGSDPVNAGWTRTYDYLQNSLIEDGSGTAVKSSNRLTRTTVNPNGANPLPQPYQHDFHGNVVRMPHLGGGLAGPNMHWDYKDHLHQVDRAGGSAAFYVYDASGQRVRKVWEKSSGLTEERIYLGGFEIFRKHNGPIGANTTTLERETLHVMDDKRHIALVETRTLDTAGDDQAPRQLIRYQFGNHLGSASLELDAQAQIISYEEYAPYGSSTYQAVRGQTEMAKRYRYTGKERDEESGFYYHVKRYCASWIGRWTSCDPLGIADGVNVFAYVRNNPVKYADPTGKQCDPTIATCPELMGNWSYSEPVPNRSSVGHNVQRDHPIQVSLRAEQRGRTGREQRAVSSSRAETTVLVETGSGYFHTEVGRFQAEINERVRAGLIRSESELIEATRDAYRLAAQATGVQVNAQALDRAIVSNLAVLSETAAQTSSELRASGVTAADYPNDADFERAFSDPTVSSAPSGSSTPQASRSSHSEPGTPAAAPHPTAVDTPSHTPHLPAAEPTPNTRAVAAEVSETAGRRILRRIAMAIPVADLVYQQVDYENTAYTGDRAFDAFLNLTVAEIWEVPLGIVGVGELLWEGAKIQGQMEAEYGPIPVPF